MIIYRPMRTKILAQGWGGHGACIDTTTGRVSGSFIGEYGYFCKAGSTLLYKYLGFVQGHPGYDMVAVKDEAIYFNVIADTTWRTDAEIDRAGGITLNVFSNEPVEVPEPEGKEAKAEWDKNGGKVYLRFIYVHANRNIERPDETVTPGAHIQNAGSTGLSSGVHVHFAMKYVDKNGNGLDKDNGMRGYVDFSQFYRDQFILDAMVEKAFLETQVSSIKELDRQIAVANIAERESLYKKLQRILLTIRAFFSRKR